jgi:predicted ATPase
MQTDPTERLFVVTGGPGAGKSTLLAALSRRGFSTMPEGGRAIIQDQVAIGGPALPWTDRSAFAELMLGWDMRSYREALELAGPVFFDRAIPDVPSYLRLCGIPFPQHVMKAAQTYRYHPRVFIAPPWERIFIQDSERRQDFAEARATYEALMEVYTSLGYELVILPLVSAEERARLVIGTLGL